MYLCQEGGGGGEGEKEHIYNHPKGGLVPPPKEGLWLGGGGVKGCWEKGGLVSGKYGIGGSGGRVVGIRVVWL